MEQTKSNKNERNESPDLQWLWDRSLDIEGNWDADKGYKKFRSRVAPARRRNLWKLSVAATVAVIVAAGFCLWKYDMSSDSVPTARSGSEAAGIKLVLDDGADILLDEKSILSYSDTTLNIVGKTGGSGEAGSSAKKNTGEESVAIPIPGARYATLVIPAGSVFAAELPDGSKVWLNAGSSLKYPLRFDDTERRVELSGEAYFDVVKNPSLPFVVTTPGGLKTRVMGTSFNISSYEDAPFTITLVTGVVEVDTRKEKLQLHASQQMVYSGGSATVRQVDAAPYVSWTSGRLGFDGDTLEQMCIKLMRWYDVDIEIEGNGMDTVRFSGYIPREMVITEAFGILYKSENIKYRFEDGHYRLYR